LRVVGEHGPLAVKRDEGIQRALATGSHPRDVHEVSDAGAAHHLSGTEQGGVSSHGLQRVPHVVQEEVNGAVRAAVQKVQVNPLDDNARSVPAPLGHVVEVRELVERVDALYGVDLVELVFDAALQGHEHLVTRGNGEALLSDDQSIGQPLTGGCQVARSSGLVVQGLRAGLVVPELIAARVFVLQAGHDHDREHDDGDGHGQEHERARTPGRALLWTGSPGWTRRHLVG